MADMSTYTLPVCRMPASLSSAAPAVSATRAGSLGQKAGPDASQLCLPQE